MYYRYSLKQSNEIQIVHNLLNPSSDLLNVNRFLFYLKWVMYAAYYKFVV